jgi:hypothetical protein
MRVIASWHVSAGGELQTIPSHAFPPPPVPEDDEVPEPPVFEVVVGAPVLVEGAPPMPPLPAGSSPPLAQPASTIGRPKSPGRSVRERAVAPKALLSAFRERPAVARALAFSGELPLCAAEGLGAAAWRDARVLMGRGSETVPTVLSTRREEASAWAELVILEKTRSVPAGKLERA